MLYRRINNNHLNELPAIKLALRKQLNNYHLYLLHRNILSTVHRIINVYAQ